MMRSGRRRIPEMGALHAASMTMTVSTGFSAPRPRHAADQGAPSLLESRTSREHRVPLEREAAAGLPRRARLSPPAGGCSRRGERLALDAAFATTKLSSGPSPAATREGATAAMRIEVSDSTLVDELAQALRRCEFSVVRTGAQRLHVRSGASHENVGTIPGAVELELDLYLKVWEVKHPGVRATRLAG
jgi:hypothetical protein